MLQLSGLIRLWYGIWYISFENSEFLDCWKVNTKLKVEFYCGKQRTATILREKI